MLRKIGIFAAVLLAAMLMGCGKSKYEEAMEEMVDVFNDMADVMATIEDEESARAAKGEMNKLAGRMQKLSALNNMEPPPPDVAMELKRKYEPQLKAAGERFMKEAFRLMMLDGVDQSMMNEMMAQMSNQGR